MIDIKERIHYTEEQLEHRFGVYHVIKTEKFQIWDSELNFDFTDIIIQAVKYRGIPGFI